MASLLLVAMPGAPSSQLLLPKSWRHSRSKKLLGAPGHTTRSKDASQVRANDTPEHASWKEQKFPHRMVSVHYINQECKAKKKAGLSVHVRIVQKSYPFPEKLGARSY